MFIDDIFRRNIRFRRFNVLTRLSCAAESTWIDVRRACSLGLTICCARRSQIVFLANV